MRKYPATPTTTTKTVSVLVPISEVSCSTCNPRDTRLTPSEERTAQTYDRTEGRKNRNRKVAETSLRLLLVSDGVRQQIDHKARLQNDASDKKELQRTAEETSG